MKIVHSDPNSVWFLAACPDCELPLLIETPTRCSDPLVWRADDEKYPWLDECPRCMSVLPDLDYDGRVPVLKEA